MPQFLLSFTAFRGLYDPDWSELRHHVARARPGAPTQQRPHPSPLPIPATMAVFCQDWNLPVDSYREYAGLLRRLARTTPDMRYPGALMAVSFCLGAPPADNPQHRLEVRNPSTPLLLTNAVHDPATGYNWATSVARQLGRDGVLLTYEGWGHGTYNSSPCAQGSRRPLPDLPGAASPRNPLPGLTPRHLRRTRPDQRRNCSSSGPAVVDPDIAGLDEHGTARSPRVAIIQVWVGNEPSCRGLAVLGRAGLGADVAGKVREEVCGSFGDDRPHQAAQLASLVRR